MSQSQKPLRLLLGQLASNGDCLYATTVARQIKTDYPGCHLTWAISSRYRAIIAHNPDVEAVWDIPFQNGQTIGEQWEQFEVEAKDRKARGDFDEIFLTQISPSNYHLWAGSVRSSILRAYPHPITVDKTPVVRLSQEEVERVKTFSEKSQLGEKAGVILFECGPQSQQSAVSPSFALAVAKELVTQHPDVAVILSSNQAIDSGHENIVDGSVLTLRENAELTKYCTLLVGCSSGVTWISTSDWAKALPLIQLVKPDLARSNSAFFDFQSRGADTTNILEMCSYSERDVVRCVGEVLTNGFAEAKRKFQQQTPLSFDHYKHLQLYLLVKFQWKKSFQLFKLNVQEYGFRPQFVLILLMLYVRCLLGLPRRLVRGFRR